MLGSGERFNSEWMTLAHGTRYKLPYESFVAFDMISDKRLPLDEVEARCAITGIVTIRVLHEDGSLHLDQVLPLIETSGHGALEAMEGASGWSSQSFSIGWLSGCALISRMGKTLRKSPASRKSDTGNPYSLWEWSFSWIIF